MANLLRPEKRKILGYNIKIEDSDKFRYSQTNENNKLQDIDPLLIDKAWQNNRNERFKSRQDELSEHLQSRKLLNDQMDVDSEEDFLKGTYVEPGGHSYISEQWNDKNKNNIKDMNPGHTGWIPGYPHVGPGNKILQKPTNEIDAVARIHDIKYDLAKTNEEIRAADREFLESMSKIEPKTWGQTAVKQTARLGIKTKQIVENTLGKTLYPSGLTDGKYYR